MPFFLGTVRAASPSAANVATLVGRDVRGLRPSGESVWEDVA